MCCQDENTGHDGSLSTGHANSTRDMFSRLETMVLQGAAALPVDAIRQQIASALDIMVHLGRLRDRTRRVLEIVEVLDYKEGEIKTNVLYKFKEEGEVNGKISGRLVKKNKLQRQDKFVAAGYKEN